jgi:hypothetical protein
MYSVLYGLSNINGKIPYILMSEDTMIALKKETKATNCTYSKDNSKDS